MRLLVILIALLPLLSGCSRAEDRAWERVQAAGTIRVGLDAAYPPFEFIDETSGEIAGFDVDLTREIGRRLGLEVSFVNITYDGLYDSLLIGSVDVLISALVATPDMAGKASFTVPYFNAGDHLVVPSGSPADSMEDLEGLTLAVEYGSGGDVEARAWQRRLGDLSVERLASPDEALAAVLEGRADAALVDGIAARLAVGQHPELMIAAAVNDALFAAAVHPDSGVLLGELNRVIEEMMADGTIEGLIERWFGG
ncbi:MAG: basic amino acid ABC transporter substrate-binding protein [Anaerolineae bacterium]